MHWQGDARRAEFDRHSGHHRQRPRDRLRRRPNHHADLQLERARTARHEHWRANRCCCAYVQNAGLMFGCGQPRFPICRLASARSPSSRSASAAFSTTIAAPAHTLRDCSTWARRTPSCLASNTRAPQTHFLLHDSSRLCWPLLQLFFSLRDLTEVFV